MRWVCLSLFMFTIVSSSFGREVQTTSSAEGRELYTPNQKEFYLTQEKRDYVRPGLHILVDQVTLNANRQAVVDLRFVDDLNQPLDRFGVITPGAFAPSFILSWYDPSQRELVSYLSRMVSSSISGLEGEQAVGESNGTYEDLGLGHARYTFNFQLPESFDGSKTHTLAIYARRDLTEEMGKQYVANTTYDFRPDGHSVVETWNAVTQEACNACHTDLAIHGGQRKDVKLCATCHNSHTIDPDTGNTMDFKEMIHKIHRGANLPSVQAGIPYQVIGFRNSVHDYSTVVYPMDIRNCQSCHGGEVTTHWMEQPTRLSCGSCHDDIDWETGDNHLAGPAANDASCAMCHPAGTSNSQFDITVVGSHTIGAKSRELAGLNVEILDVQGAEPGGMLEVTFRISDNHGNFIDPNSLSRFRFLVSGPNQDFSQYYQEDGFDAVLEGDAGIYQFATPLPEDASGSWTISADTYRFVNINVDSIKEERVREAAFNPIFAFAVTDSQAMPRREIVSQEKCNACHDALALHGGQRINVNECSICHNPLMDDHEVRPEDRFPAESIDFRRMIHRIHRGEALTQEFTVFGHGGSEYNYNHVRMPGIISDCAICHIDGTQNIPDQEGLLITITERDWMTSQRPATAACLGCHDDQQSTTHALVNTSPFAESCAVCHGEDKEFSVDRVHAR